MFGQHAIQLPLHFDPQALAADMDRVLSAEWIGHYRHQEYEGDWAIVPLRSVGGHPAIIHAVPGARRGDFFKNTEILERCTYFRSVIDKFQCPVGAARLMRLGAGAKILEHCDDMGRHGSGQEELRIHIPVQTNPGVRFVVDGHCVSMQPGQVWYADFSLPHQVDNDGDSDRIHLVLDCAPDAWLLDQIRKGDEIRRISAFLNEIGIGCSVASVPDDTFLPGVEIREGAIVFDPERLVSPGDLLHEAGHIAVVPAGERAALSGDLGQNDQQAMGHEIAAILWSYAALRAIGLPEATVFHPQGYKGQGDWYLRIFRDGHYPGLPLLEWMGLCVGSETAARTGQASFPAMQAWLRA